MDIQELFLREFEDYRFTEIQRNPPNSLLTSPKPNAKQNGRFFGILTDGLSFGKKSYGIPGKDAIEEELEKELKKQEPDFYDYLLAYMDKKGITDEAPFPRSVPCAKQNTGPASQRSSSFAWRWNSLRMKRKKCFTPLVTACPTLRW